MNRNAIFGKRGLSAAGMAVGIILLIAGIIVSLNGLSDRAGGILLGVGAGLIGASLSGLAAVFIENRNPAIVRQKQIDVNDERNIALRDKAGARANTIIMTVIMLTAFGLTMAGVDLYISLILFGLILVNAVLYVASFNYFSKRL